MESEKEHHQPLHPKLHPLAAEAVVGNATRSSLLVVPCIVHIMIITCK